MNVVKVGLHVSSAVLVVLATTGSIAALQMSAQQQPRVALGVQTESQQTGLPQWPFPPDSPTAAIPPDDGQPHHVPGSTQAYTLKQVYKDSSVDWFQDMHPKLPVSVMDGKTGAYRACGSCHLINGNGKTDMENLNGLPVAYMRQQMEDMKNDQRHGAVPSGSLTNMIVAAKAVSEADVKEALEYFHSIGPNKLVRVVETDTVPKTVFGLHGLALADTSGAKVPIGNQIVEMPESYERSLLRDPTSTYVAYVPSGSLSKGEAIVKRGAGGHTMACSTCHGNDLRGMGDTMPPIAGRSPTAMGRQLYDFKTGARHGTNSAMMKPIVEKLTDEDIVNISAYLASLPQ